MKKIIESIKNTFSNMDKKLKIYLLVLVALVVLILVFIFVASSLKGNKLTFDKIEDKMVSAATSYYKKNNEKLPILDGEKVVVDVDTLVESKEMKELSKLVKNNASCTGKVTVQRNGDFYLYTPYLDCGGNYKTVNLIEKIRLDNPIVIDGDGLYQIGENQVFRGEKVNNFVSFDNKIWRIIRINDDGSLKLIEDEIIYTGVFDDRFNINRNSYDGINDFEKSRLKDGLIKIYEETDLFSDKAKSKMVTKDLCVGKRDFDETNNSGDIECSVKATGIKVGLIQANEFALASLDTNCRFVDNEQCSNYNYLSNYTKTTWTITADLKNSHKAYKFNGSNVTSSTASNEYGLRVVINISDNINYISGNGTKADPYVIK